MDRNTEKDSRLESTLTLEEKDHSICRKELSDHFKHSLALAIRSLKKPLCKGSKIFLMQSKFGSFIMH